MRVVREVNLFEIKICGVRIKSDIEAAERAGADAIGLNFFPASRRYLDPSSPDTEDLARAAAESRLLRIGVFVNESAARMVEIASTIGLDAVQLHGDERPEILSELAQRWDQAAPGLSCHVIRAIKLPTGLLSADDIDQAIRPWTSPSPPFPPVHFLLDADAGAAHGGSGKCLSWQSIRAWADRWPQTNWTLAGGLSTANVAEAVRVSGARSIDVASGVEAERDTKSSDLIHRFCTQARSAWQ